MVKLKQYYQCLYIPCSFIRYPLSVWVMYIDTPHGRKTPSFSCYWNVFETLYMSQICFVGWLTLDMEVERAWFEFVFLLLLFFELVRESHVETFRKLLFNFQASLFILSSISMKTENNWQTDTVIPSFEERGKVCLNTFPRFTCHPTEICAVHEDTLTPHSI